MIKVENLIVGEFVERPNRFLVMFEKENGKIREMAHLRDPGRLTELLIPGVKLLLREVKSNPNRKTKYDVIAVYNQDTWILINSGFHSDIAEDLIESGVIKELNRYSVGRREFAYGKSRLDFLLDSDEGQMLLEVKGCTLVEDGVAKFPDAPTIRGKKHLDELAGSRHDGYESAVLFLILREDAKEFKPNKKMDPDFTAALKNAESNGVQIFAYTFTNIYSNNTLCIKPKKRVKIFLL